MDTIADKKLDDLLAPARDEDITPEHREWMNEQIRETLAKKERGEMKYKSLNEVRRKFGLDAS